MKASGSVICIMASGGNFLPLCPSCCGTAVFLFLFQPDGFFLIQLHVCRLHKIGNGGDLSITHGVSNAHRILISGHGLFVGLGIADLFDLLHGDGHVFQHRQVVEQTDVLEGTGDALVVDHMGRKSLELLAIQKEGAGGGTIGTPIIKHIEETKPMNVIVITDSDITDIQSLKTVPGAVWMLFYGSKSDNLIQNLRGKKESRWYMVW